MRAEPAQPGWQALTPHPQTPCAALHSVRAALQRTGQNRLLARFRFEGRIDLLRVPPPVIAQRVDGLWRNLCGELFAMAPDGRYAEFNLAPSGCWAAYEFDDYRSGMRPAQLVADPVVVCQRNAGLLELDADLTLPAVCDVARLRVALCATVEEAGGVLSCWALKHTADRPDFHLAGGFVELAE